ncbi:hypothetical protein E2L08_14275 [Palleronia sediminis]|uniref:Uncharacterized protein n=1 Tax=Palleronia sediminis TaxID=2547833 RepID=A0A4R6A0R8_9RHOB|nr:hypothetical protein [Palleronia sediminis]TDL76255.1 hypothetical protein E2L08_14275 [Palleronia sediminis]
MPEGGRQSHRAGTSLGRRTAPRARPKGAALGWGATIVWLAICALTLYGLAGGEAGLDPLRILMIPVAVMAPIVLVWIAVGHARRLDLLRREMALMLAPIQDELAAIAARSAAMADAQEGAGPVARFTSSRHRGAPGGPSVAAAVPSSQQTFALDSGQATDREVSHADLIAALQFPADAEDAEGFAALRRAMQDRRLKRLVTSAQDTLTLMSQDGIYMDDLDREPARPETWRRFARGERGMAVGGLGGIRDAAAIEATIERMRGDTVFRGTALHFMRTFDEVLSEVEPALSDAEIAALADTRTARAFMLVGRAIGTFT